MASFLDKISIPKATGKVNKFDLSCDNITTNEFFQTKVVYTRELIPGQSVDIDLVHFCRLAPLYKPYYGSAKFVNRLFFVPYRTIMKGWNEFITDTLLDSQLPTVPYLSNKSLVTALIQPTFAVVTTSDSPDVVVKTGSLTSQKYLFNEKGRYAFDLLQNLGYMLDFDTSKNGEYLSALPLLAYQKVFRDWYANKQYQTDNFSPIGGRELAWQEIANLFDECYVVNYEKDYFTSAWDRPSAPSAGQTPNIIINDATNDTRVRSDVHTNHDTGTPEISLNGTGAFTQYLDTALHKVTDYLKRHQLVGALALDRYYARFGIHLTDAALQRSTYIGKSETPVQIADVMSTVAPSTALDPALGEYAGKGIASNNGHFNFKTEEYGQLIMVSVLLPKISYAQGRDRQLMHRGKLHFATPEFDMLGVQAIDKSEIRGQYLGVNGHRTWADGSVFGFTSRYAEYKVGKDRITGLFGLRLDDPLRDENRWHFARLFEDDDDLTHDKSFCSPDLQYNRVFADTDSTADHFISVYHFNITSHMPLARLFDDYEWSECDAPELTNNLNGTQMD